MKSERSFSDEVLRRLGLVEPGPFELKFRAAWNRMAEHQGVKDLPPESTQARAVWRMAFAQAIAESVDPHFDPRKVAGSAEERAATQAANSASVEFLGKVVLVCGGRDYDDEGTVDAALSATHAKLGIALLVHGGQERKRRNGPSVGADYLAKRWAMSKGIQTCSFDANWDALSRKAGPVRNEAMAHFLRVDVGVAFPGGVGTDGMCAILEARGVKVWRVPKRWRPDDTEKTRRTA